MSRSRYGTPPSRGADGLGGAVGDAPDLHGDDPAPLHVLGAELEALEADRLPFLGNVPEQVEHEPADRVPFGVGQLDAELVADVVDRGAAGDAERSSGEALDAGLLHVVL